MKSRFYLFYLLSLLYLLCKLDTLALSLSCLFKVNRLFQRRVRCHLFHFIIYSFIHSFISCFLLFFFCGTCSLFPYFGFFSLYSGVPATYFVIILAWAFCFYLFQMNDSCFDFFRDPFPYLAIIHPRNQLTVEAWNIIRMIKQNKMFERQPPREVIRH